MSVAEDERKILSIIDEEILETTVIERINKLVERFSRNETNELSKKFEGKSIPKISINDYLKRIRYYLNNEQSTYLISLIYLERFCEINKVDLRLENLHRLYIISLVVAIKYNEDESYGNVYYSKVGGIPVSCFNKLETLFLEKLNYSLYVSYELFDKIVSSEKFCEQH